MDEEDLVPLNVHPSHANGVTVPQWALKLNSAVATTENWHLKDLT